MPDTAERMAALKLAIEAGKGFEAGFAKLGELVALGTAPDLVAAIHAKLVETARLRDEGN